MCTQQSGFPQVCRKTFKDFFMTCKDHHFQVFLNDKFWRFAGMQGTYTSGSMANPVKKLAEISLQSTPL